LFGAFVLDSGQKCISTQLTSKQKRGFTDQITRVV